MPDDVDLFFAPCSREHKEDTYRHFRNTVLDGISANAYPAVRAAGFPDKIGVWGVVSGNKTYWGRLDLGDPILFYTKSGVYTHVARVTGKEINEELGDRIWTTYDGKRLVRDLDEPWPYIIYLSDVEEVNIPADEVHDAFGYSMEYPQGFMRPADDKHQTLRKEYNTVTEFLQKYTNTLVNDSPTTLKSAQGSLVEKVASEPELREDRSRFTETKCRIRTRAFRKQIRELYDERCCICGAHRKSPTGVLEIEAAHIYPKRQNGSDDPRNGLALCQLHHWAFDSGWLSLTDEYTLLVKDEPNCPGYEEFQRLAEQPIRLPDSSRFAPHPVFLEEHRVLHGFE